MVDTDDELFASAYESVAKLETQFYTREEIADMLEQVADELTE